jgi:hypothetical protein
MMRIVHARIDPATEKLLEGLKRQLGWSDSKAVREGIKALEILLAPSGRRIVGLGQFCSGIPDLGSSKRHLKGFGR